MRNLVTLLMDVCNSTRRTAPKPSSYVFGESGGAHGTVALPHLSLQSPRFGFGCLLYRCHFVGPHTAWAHVATARDPKFYFPNCASHQSTQVEW